MEERIDTVLSQLFPISRSSNTLTCSTRTITEATAIKISLIVVMEERIDSVLSQRFPVSRSSNTLTCSMRTPTEYLHVIVRCIHRLTFQILVVTGEEEQLVRCVPTMLSLPSSSRGGSLFLLIIHHASAPPLALSSPPSCSSRCVCRLQTCGVSFCSPSCHAPPTTHILLLVAHPSRN
jgi:hypothetical protein